MVTRYNQTLILQNAEIEAGNSNICGKSINLRLKPTTLNISTR